MNLIENLADGEIKELESGEIIFQLASHVKNPIVRPENLGLTWKEHGKLKTGAVFNGGAEIFGDQIVLTPRCQWNYRQGKFVDERTGIERECLENYVSEIWPLISDDGIHFERFKNITIRGDGTDHQAFVHGIEDMRIIKYEDLFLLVGCGKMKEPFKHSNADRIAIYTTKNFTKINYHGIVDVFDSRNAVPFPRQIKGNLYTLLRFHPNIHLGRLKAGINQLLQPTKYPDYWKEIYTSRDTTLLLQTGVYPHEREKIGPGPQLVETQHGWLLIYHAVGEIGINICRAYGLSQKIERGYSICAALLDLEDPRKIICRTSCPIYIPSAPYELYGNKQFPVDVPAVVFPVGAIVVKQDKLLIYAGAADKYVIHLSCGLNHLVSYLLEHCKL